MLQIHIHFMEVIFFLLGLELSLIILENILNIYKRVFFICNLFLTNLHVTCRYN